MVTKQNEPILLCPRCKKSCDILHVGLCFPCFREIGEKKESPTLKPAVESKELKK